MTNVTLLGNKGAALGKKDPDVVSLAFAQTVRHFRERRKGKAGPMTQEELARRLGMDRSYITALESGSHNPTLMTIWKLLPVLRVTPANFMRHLARNYERLKPDPPATGNED